MNLENQQFGILTVLEKAPIHTAKTGKQRAYWRCLCECGKEKEIIQDSLVSGRSKSCGCKVIEASKARIGGLSANFKHGKSKTKTHAIWCGMISRCGNPNSTSFKNYGAKGISVCDRWNDFSLFLKDMGEVPDNFSIDRIDTNGNYEPGNCRWATMKTQQRNRRNNRMVTISGVTKTLSEWSESSGIRHNTLQYRIKTGWPEDRLLSPSRQQLQLV